MADDKFWEPTMKVLEGIFKKPKMSDKLLQKPPFKYLFDIVLATMEATHFGDGLFTPAELDINSYENRDQKIMFLRKVLDLTQFAIGKGLAAKPNKIVAGLEPENTNLFLQEYGRSAITPDLAKKGPKIIKKLLAKYEEEAKGGDGAASQAPAAEKPQPAQQKEEPPKQEKQRPEKKEESQKAARPSVPAAGSVDEPVAVVKPNVRPSSALKVPPKIQSGLVKVQDNPRQGQGRGTSGVIIDRGNSQNDNDEEPQNQNTQQQGYSESAATGKGKSKFTSEALNDALVPQAAQNNPDQDENAAPKGGIKMSLKGKKSSAATTSSSASAATASTTGAAAASGATDIAGLTLLVQEIAKNANPLGKSLEFIMDDIESMNHELDYWTKQYKASKEKLQSELKTSDELLQPLQDQIAEIDEKISDQKNRVQNMKAQLIKNASQIQTLLYSVVSTK